MDEKGFMIGILQASKRYFTSAEHSSRRLRGVGQDGSREWVTIVASICQDSSTLPPSIIYAAATNNHKDTWYGDLDTCEAIAHFATSSNGWTNDNLGYQWLTQVFNRHTKRKARHSLEYRLLFVDGHSSHLNMRFIEFCDQNKILLMAYPPHSTHRLQPLDVSLFNPLSSYYSQNLDDWLRTSFGVCSMSKRHFWSIFKPAFDQAFSQTNIESAWRKTGLHPLDPEVVLSQVRILEPRPPSSTSSASAFSSSSWKRANKHLKDTYGPALTRDEKKIVNTLDYLCAETQHQRLQIKLLEERLQLQEKQNKRGKTLFNELRAESDTKAIFFSPNKVQEARDLLAQRKLQKQEEEKRKRLQKMAREEAKRRRQLELAERRLQRAARKQEKERLLEEGKRAREEAKIQKQSKKQLQIDRRFARQQEARYQRKSIRSLTAAAPISVNQRPAVQEPGPSRSRPQRRLPQRYRN